MVCGSTSSVTREKFLFSLPLLHKYRGHKVHWSLPLSTLIDFVCDSEYDLKSVFEADEGADGSCCGGRVGKELKFFQNMQK